MSASIVLTGLASNDPLPGIFMQVSFAQGASTGSGLTRAIVVLANKTAAGVATSDTEIYGPDTLVPLQTEDDMRVLGGPGSEAHRLFRMIAPVNKVTPIYWVFVTESAGSKATGTVTIATTATGPGTHRLWIGDEETQTSIAKDMTATQIAAAIVENVNAKTHLPVTAANTDGAVTLTAKQNGARGNLIRFMAAISAGIGTTTTATTDAFLSGGATDDDLTAALATISKRRFGYIVPAATDATQLGALIAQVNAQALATNGRRQRVVAATIDTLANAITLATGINAARGEMGWAEKSPHTPGELAAQLAAIYALGEANEDNPRTNFIGYGTNDEAEQATWRIKPPRLASAIPSETSIRSALNNGLSPIAVTENGLGTYLVNRITTRSLNGATPDYRIRPAHKVTICDLFADKLQVRIRQRTAGKRIGNDPPQGARVPGPLVATERTMKMLTFALLDEFEGNDLLQTGRIDAIKAGCVFQRETNPSTRMGIRVPLEPIDNFEQAAVDIQQVA